MTIPLPARTIAAANVRRLKASDLPHIVDLQAAVAAALPATANFIRDKSAGELRAYLDGTRGVAYGVVDGDALQAMALLRLPSAAHRNQAGDPPFPLVPATDWPFYAAFLENAMVRPAARGRGYQRALLDVRLFRAAALGMRWICAGANLSNAVSWKNMLAKGMAIAGIRRDLGFPLIGLLAALDKTALKSDPRDCVAVDAQDQARHHAALRDGYIGVRLAADGAVIYQRLTSHA